MADTFSIDMELRKVEDVKQGKYDMVNVKGVRLDNGEEWSKKTFATLPDGKRQPVLKQLDNFDVGDNVRVILKKNNKNYWNISGFEEVPEGALAKYNSNTNNNTGSSGKGGPGGGYTPTGPTRGHDTNRSASIYLAKELVFAVHTETALRKMNADTLFAEVARVSELVYGYIAEGNIETDLPWRDGDDPLDPPAED